VLLVVSATRMLVLPQYVSSRPDSPPDLSASSQGA